MHMLSLSLLLMQSIRKLKLLLKLWYKLISLIYFSDIELIFMQIFNVSILCKQSIRLFQQKQWYELISPYALSTCMHEQNLLIKIK